MVTKEEAKKKLKELIQDFKDGEKYWDSKPEADIKHQFIEPLFENVLGWNRKDVLMEARVLKDRADYILKKGNQEVLVIEAKRTNISLTEEEGRQAVSYAYHRKIKFSVLTNFKQLKVFHALSNIKNINKNLLKVEGNYFILDYQEFLDKFDILWLLSRESFEKSEINKLLSVKDERLNKPIDENILNDLLKIRDWLSKDLKSKRMQLTQEKIDEIVQMLIDRLIFIRSVEDRGLEPMNYLRSLESDVNRQQATNLQLYPYLLQNFEKLNGKYDSGLFEKGLLETEGAFSNDLLKKVILALYFGSEGNQERYLFDQIPGDLFGSIYEQYLGTILAGTEKRVKLDSSSGKRKKMGIYYTPSYIVDYIIKNTVGEYIKDKSIDEILDINILDPACGSGSFLVRAFQEVCDKIEELLRQKKYSKKWNAFEDYSNRLTFPQKVAILKNCIYGVDLDEKAIELARLNLMLKTLEGEGLDTKSVKLPKLLNVKCGNSLIDDPKVSEHAFKWESEFRDVLVKGGFDVVVGNPPYIRNRELIESEKHFFDTNFETAEGQYDIYQLFFEKSINLLKETGVLGFITSNKYAITSYGKKLRKYILEKSKIEFIIDVSNISVFREASTYPYILILLKTMENIAINKINIAKMSSELEIQNLKYSTLYQKSLLQKEGYEFDINEDKTAIPILDKITKQSIKLGDLAVIKETVHTGNVRDKILVTTRINPFCNKILRGKDCQRYYFVWQNFWINTDDTVIDKNKGEYATIPNKSYFEKPKLFLREIAERLTVCYDEERYYSLNKAYVLSIKDNKISIKLLLGLLNSSLLSWFFRIRFESAHVRGGHLQFKKQYTSQIPIKIPASVQEKKIISLVNQMLELQKKYHNEKIIGNEKERLKSQIDAVDYEIDQEVYKLYELTPEEINIVEESLK